MNVNEFKLSGYVPESLKSRALWVLWRMQKKDGRETKVPYSAITGRGASSTDPTTWTTYEKALQMLQGSKHYNGLGLMIPEDSGLVFIDVDHCIDAQGNLNEQAEFILSALPDQYTELSQSETGIHIIAEGIIPQPVKNSAFGVELYSSKRYCALTGKTIIAAEPRPNPQGISAVYEKFKTTAGLTGTGAQELTLRDVDPAEAEKVLQLAKSNGGKMFSDLFSGNWQGIKDTGGDQRFPSQSEADLSLLNRLAYYSDNDPSIMDFLFRQSGLYRPKWERLKQRALPKAFVEESYSQYLERMKDDFRDVIPSDGEITKSDVLKAVETVDIYHNREYRRRDELNLSKLFGAVFKSRARYNATAKEWFIYNGVKWTQDTGGMIVSQYAKTFYEALTIYAAGLSDENDPANVEAFRKYVSKLGDSKKRKSLIDDSRDQHYLTNADFDRNPNLFNCFNCVIDLSSGEVLKHDPALFLSKVSGAVYDPEANDPKWENAVSEMLQGDTEKIRYLQQLCGYTLTGNNNREECYILYGSTTRNGKSTFLETLGAMFGEYGLNTQPETFAKDKNRSSKTPSGDIARLNNCRFLHMSEPPKSMIFDVGLLKTLTGRDKMTARNLYEREFEFTPCFVLFINTNYLPRINDDSIFSSDRIKVISFDRHFTASEQKPNLKRDLKSTKSLSSVLNWCLQGLRRYQAADGKISVPESVRKATAAYRHDSDKVQLFIDDRLIFSPGNSILGSDAYYEYACWCRGNGYTPEGKRNFFDELRRKGLLADTATINGKTAHNVLRDYALVEDY